MRLMEEIFFSGTFGGEALSLAASIAVVDKMRRENVIEALARSGTTLKAGVEKRIREHGLDNCMSMAGLPFFGAVMIGDHPKARKEVVRTLFSREMLRNGVLMHTTHNVCYAHNQSDLADVLQAYDATLAVMREELGRGDAESRLGCAMIEPVFKVRG
jgi:glutamate-1-semialdehyde 2,1-aminomutase/spore coat polysaccharide biosynthesis protein SpsF